VPLIAELRYGRGEFGESVEGARTEHVGGVLPLFHVPDGVKVTQVQWTPGYFGSAVQWEVRR
jgi:hypothetical protein